MRVSLGLSFCLACTALSMVAQSTPSAELEELLKSGSSLLEKADYAHAIPLLRRATELAPRDGHANQLLGAALLQSGDPADAISPLRIAAAATPVSEAAEGYLGDAEMEIDRFADAAETFQSAVSRSPRSEQVLVWWTGFCLERYRRLSFSLRETSRGRAELLLIASANDKVELKTRKLWLNQAASIEPDLSEVWGELGIVEMTLSEPAEAEANLKRALQFSPRALHTFELQTLIDASHGEWITAEKNLGEIEERSRFEAAKFFTHWPRTLVPPESSENAIWKCLGEGSRDCSSKINGAEPRTSLSAEQLYAESRWEQLAALPDPASGATNEWLWRGIAFAALGNCRRAIPALERGLPAGAESAAAHLADCYQQQAIDTADQMQVQGRVAAVHQIRGDILLSIRQDAAQALKEYAAALSLKPNDPQLLEKSAEARFSLGDLTGAKADAQAALDVNPNRIQLLRLLIRILISERDYPAALALIDRFSQIAPADNWVHVQQGKAYAATGRAEAAAQHLKVALDAGYSDERGALHALLATQLRKLGRTQEANIATAEAIKLADSFQEQSQHGDVAPE